MLTYIRLSLFSIVLTEFSCQIPANGFALSQNFSINLKNWDLTKWSFCGKREKEGKVRKSCIFSFKIDTLNFPSKFSELLETFSDEKVLLDVGDGS